MKKKTVRNEDFWMMTIFGSGATTKKTIIEIFLYCIKQNKHFLGQGLFSGLVFSI